MRFYIPSEESWCDAGHACLDDIQAARSARLDTLAV
jgi:hypothetical protein